MRKSDLLDEMLDSKVFANSRTARKYMMNKYNILQADFELLLELHSFERFTRRDFTEGEITMSWNQGRWCRLYTEDQLGYIILAKEIGKGSRYRSYGLAPKTKRMMREYYEYCCGTKKVPANAKDLTLAKGYADYMVKLKLTKQNM